MNFSALSQNEKIALIAGAVVAITGLLSIFWEWGAVMLISVLGGLLAIAVILQPNLVRSVRLTGSKGSLLLLAGIGATLVNVLRGVDAVGYLTRNIASLDALQFIAGIVAAIALLYAGWMAYRSETGTASATSAPVAPRPAAESPIASDPPTA